MQLPWNIVLPFKNVSMKKWLKEIKQRRKEEGRLRRAEVHAAISVAGVAAALAAIAAENSKKDVPSTAKEAAVASAAALVAAQCAKVAEAMGAKREQLSSLIGSAMSGTNASDHILTLTAAAATCKTIYPSSVGFFFFFFRRIIWGFAPTRLLGHRAKCPLPIGWIKLEPLT